MKIVKDVVCTIDIADLLLVAGESTMLVLDLLPGLQCDLH